MMIRRKPLWTLALLGTALTLGVGLPGPLAQTAPTSQPALASNGRIAIVDVQRILARSVAGAAAREALEKEKAVMQKQVDSQRAELEKLREELEKKGQLLSPEARREKQETLERKLRDTRRLVDDLQGTLQKKEDAMLQKVLQDVGGLIQKVGKERGFSVILERQRSGVLYASADVDLTDDVLKAYDAETKKGGGK